jgi:CheY-like chemotaxis protein
VVRQVLWVDDNPDNNDAERQYLTQLGIRVDLATSTSKALDRMQRQRYDLVLSDIQRGWNPWAGLQLLKKIRSEYPGIPVIFYTMNYEASKGLPDGALGVTTRPDELFNLIGKVLKHSAV